MVLRPGEVAALPPRVTPTLHGGTGVQRWERTCPRPTSRTLVFCLRDVTVSDGWCAVHVRAGGGGCTGGLPAQTLFGARATPGGWRAVEGTDGCTVGCEWVCVAVWCGSRGSHSLRHHPISFDSPSSFLADPQPK